MFKRRFALVMLLAALITVLIPASIAAQDGEFMVRVIEVESKAPLARLSPDKNLIVVYHEPIINNFEPQDRYVWLIDAATGEEVVTLTDATDFISDAAFNADGSVLALAQTNGDILLWDVESQSVLKTFELPFYGGVRPLEFSPDGARLMFMSAGNTGQIVFLDIETGYIVKILAPHFATRQEFMESVGDAFGRTAFTYVTADLSPDGETVAVATGNDAVFLWEVGTGDQLMLRPESEEKARFNVTGLAYSADGGTLVYTMPAQEIVSVRDAERGNEIASLAINANVFALSPDGTHIAWGNRDEPGLYFASIDQIDSPQTLTALPSTSTIGPRLTRLEFSADGQTLMLSGLVNLDGTDNAIYLFERE